MPESSYNQFCPVAMAAEVLGARWTLLLLRELVCGTTRFNDLATLDIGEDHGRPIVSIFRGRLLAPLVLRIFERHPLGSQAFVPLSGRPFLAAVAPAGVFDPLAVRVFRAVPTQGVNYARGTWHHFLLPLEAESDFLVIDRAGPGDNLDEIELGDETAIRVRD